jgi:hypothetical protein
MKEFQYTLIGFTAFGRGQTPKRAVVLSRHYTSDAINKTWIMDKSGLALDLKKHEGEKVDDDMREHIKNKYCKQRN